MSARIAFCTTCKGRAQHLKMTLPQNLIDNEDYPNAVFIVLDYGSQDDLLAWLKRDFTKAIEQGRIVVYSMNNGGPFQMAHAKNVAHRCGILEHADILVNLDADQYAGKGAATYLAHAFATNPRGFLWARMIKGKLVRGVNGRIAVTTDAFLKVGGYDERFSTWSRDDKDFCARLKRLGYVAYEFD